MIKKHSEGLGHVPLIDENPGTADRKTELKGKRNVCYKTVDDIRYNERSNVERVNGRLKAELGARMV